MLLPSIKKKTNSAIWDNFDTFPSDFWATIMRYG